MRSMLCRRRAGVGSCTELVRCRSAKGSSHTGPGFSFGAPPPSTKDPRLGTVAIPADIDPRVSTFIKAAPLDVRPFESLVVRLTPPSRSGNESCRTGSLCEAKRCRVLREVRKETK